MMCEKQQPARPCALKREEAQKMPQHTHIAIDLKSFYASVECCERELNPLDTNLVVADESRTDKTIRLAVTPSLKSYGIPDKVRLFEVRQKIKTQIPCVRAKHRDASRKAHPTLPPS